MLKALQVVQNKAARCVTRKSWFTATRQLLKECGWLSIRQLAFYHTVLTIHRILRSEKPVYLRNKVTFNHPYSTRQATGGCVRFDRASNLEGSFINRAARDYNSIPNTLKIVTSLPYFKTKLKKWTVANIPVE